MEGPLSDVVVLDLTRALSGPIAARLLSDLGATVVKVEPPSADMTRSIVPHVGDVSTYFVHCNAGKRCVSIDLTHPDGRDLLLRMVDHADVLVENYRPDVMGRLGLGFDVLSGRNPRLIVVSISGWGHGNSRSADGAFAAAMHAETGLTQMIARERDEAGARNDPFPHADVYGGLQGLAAVLAALHQRHRTGRGQFVDVSMAESTCVANDQAAGELTGQRPREGFLPGQHRTPIHRLGSGRLVNVLSDPTNPGGFIAWCRAMGRSDLADDPRFGTQLDRTAHRTDLDAVLAEWVATFGDVVALQAAFAPSGVLVAEVRSVGELADSQWSAERGAFVPVDVGNGGVIRVPQAPWRFSDAATGVRPMFGRLGEHNHEVLATMAGADDEEIERLERAGVLHAR